MLSLSIITVNLNNRIGLQKTLQSVACQRYMDYEFIIIDGASTDGSIEKLMELGDQKLRWISEPDSGIYNAMNKGIRMAIGEYCLFLNSGDWLADEMVLQNVFATNPEADIVAGNIYFFDSSKGKINWFVPSPDEFTAKTLFNGTLPHQATFIKRSLFEKYGFYNENFRIVSDWLFFLEVLLEHGASYKHYDGVIAFFNMEGISFIPETNHLPRVEQLAVLQQKYSRFIADYELMDKLDKKNLQWETSLEYKVFEALNKIGIIAFGVLILRSFNYLCRKLQINHSTQKFNN